MAQAETASFSFKSITVHKDQVLGVGSYGTVCRAQCDELPCAAKVLHGELVLPFQQAKRVPASRVHRLPARRFQQECDFLSKIRHPNIVLFLGISQDPATNLPVLLMELMEDGNLTVFLENPDSSIPFRTEVSICHDIAQALSFLHSNNIIHRDLSSNNILMIGDKRAKVTDFGMAVLEDARRKRTVMPGTAAYMPPEVKGENPTPTAKTDVFSLGVLTVQVLTREFPKPAEVPLNHGTFNLWDTFTGTESETGKRQNHISLIDKDHPLKPLALNCLKDNYRTRPTASDLCQLLRDLLKVNYTCTTPLLKQTPQRQLLQELDGNQEDLGRASKGGRGREKAFHESLSIPREGRRNFTKNEQYSRGTFGRIVEDIGKVEIEEFEEITVDELHTLPFSAGAQVSDISKMVSIKWMERGQKMPHAMCRRTNCVSLSNEIFLLFGQRLFSFHALRAEWSELNPPPVQQGSLAVVSNRVVLVGGKDSSRLHSLVDGEWKTKLPSMSMKRHSAITASTSSYLIVIGGVEKGGKHTRTIEVLDTDALRWSTVANFPEVCASLVACVCSQRLYVLGYLNTIFSCEVDALVNSSGFLHATQREDLWERVENLPVASSTCVAMDNSIYAVGGKSPNGHPTDAVYCYNPVKGTWSVYSHMHVPRSQCFAGFVGRNTLLAMGGVKESGQPLDTVETARWKFI